MKNIYLLICLSLLYVDVYSQNNFFYSNTVHHFETVVNGNQQWKYLVGTTEPDSNWRKLTFNDATWSAGNGGIGYGDNDDATPISTCSSVYMRKQFSISDTSKITELLLSIDYDDGFVAYINNVEIARKNIGTVGVIPTYNTLATAAHEANLYNNLNAEYFFIDKNTIHALVKNGTNVLCIQVHNNTTSGADNDLTAIPYLMAGLNNSSTVYAQNPSWFKPPFYSHMPIIQILTGNQVVVNEPKRTMGMRIIYNGLNQNHISDSATEYSGKAGVELHGASSLGFAQKSYGITPYDSMGLAQNVKILDFPKESDFILYAPWNDKTLMRNVMMYDLARKMGWYAPRCRFVELFLDTSYVGVYVLMEKIKIDKERVAISQVKPNHNAGDSLTGGYIFKIDWNSDPGLGTWSSHVNVFNGQTKSITFQTSDPNGLDITVPQRLYIESFIDSFEQNLIGPTFANPTTGYRKYIDVGSFIDFFILNEITHSVDAYRASTYFFKNKSSQGGKLVMGPVWDFNFSLGNCTFCNSNDTNGWSGCTANNTIWWFDQLNSENFYKDQLRCRWSSLYYSLLSPLNINAYIDSVAAYLEVPQLRHFIRWNILATDLYNGHLSSEYSQEITWMKNWYRGRSTWLNWNMPGWHNPCYESTFANRVFVTELNYNSDKNLDGGNWIELYNNSSGAVNLANSSFTANGGANSKKLGNITIPAFSYLVLCEDTALFNKIYPDVINKVGNLGFGFNNTQGKLTLYDQNSYFIFNFLYSSEYPWPQGANGGGRTLEHRGINSTYNNPSNWFEGCIGGSPGRAYGRCRQDLNITEINYTAAASHNTGDWFEIKNNSSTSKNIGGYVFKDADSAHSFIFPPNFTIAANDYYVICADTAKFKSLHPTIKNRLGNFNFGISNKSDAIRLYTSNNSLYQSIYYTDTAAPWPNGANGTGFTIELKNDTFRCDDGMNWTTGCIYGSPGKRYHKLCNPALSAKINISELNLKPAIFADDGGWIELHNYDNVDLDLTDFLLSHATSQDTAYLIKEGTILKKNSYLVFCNDVTKFKKWHPLITNVYPLNKWKFNPNTDSIVLKDYNNSTLIGMKYTMNAALLSEANGLGKTLELKYDTSNLNNVSSWFDGCFKGSPAQAFSKCAKSKLIVSEINYNSSPNFKQGFWFEIKNVDTATINLNKYFFRRAYDTTIYYFKKNTTIAPNQYLALSFDSTTFKEANPFISNVMFLTQPLMLVKGDIIQLFDSSTQWLNVQYKDTLPFPLLANGLGYTLNLTHDTLNPFLASSYRTDCFGGSPGTAPLLPCNPALSSNISISEINYLSDANTNSGFWFEIKNNTSVALPLLNWFVTSADLKKNYPILSNVILPSNGFLVFASDTIKFKQQHPSVSNFTFIPAGIFNSNNDSIKLFDYRGFLACKAFYSNDSTWTQGANGLGYTLEKNNIAKNAITANDWRCGCLKGSPGKAFIACEKAALIVSEINYRSSINTNAGQWFELKNTLTTSLNLNNYEIRFNTTDSLEINYTLAPKQYLVIASDSILFKKQHPYISNVVYAGFKLDTLKNTIKLFELNKLTNSICYNTQNIALQASNGGGYTLELINDTLNETAPESWTIECLKGSPGTALLSPCEPALTSNLFFSEINYLADTFNNSGPWVELYNKSTQPVNLQNWVLQNKSSSYVSFLSSFIIPAQSYWVLSNDTAKFHAIYPLVQNVTFANLKLSPISDSIFLHDYSETQACKAFYNNTPAWPQGPNGHGRTLENYTTSKSSISLSDWREGCILGSPGKASSTCADSVIITELNYAPQNSTNDGKWIEFFIYSSNSNINKFTFRLNDSITSYTLSKPIKNNGFLVLCADTIAFNKYHPYISNKEQFSTLNMNSGTNSLVIYDQNNALLQSIQYSSLAPWDSLANGKGYTLELLKDSSHFSVADNWKAFCKRGSPGSETVLPCGNAFGIKATRSNTTPQIYPNPAGHELTLDVGLSSFKNIEFEVRDILGQVLLHGSLQKQVTQLDIRTLSAGVYFIQFNDLVPLKFVKK